MEEELSPARTNLLVVADGVIGLEPPFDGSLLHTFFKEVGNLEPGILQHDNIVVFLCLLGCGNACHVGGVGVAIAARTLVNGLDGEVNAIDVARGVAEGVDIRAVDDTVVGADVVLN